VALLTVPLLLVVGAMLVPLAMSMFLAALRALLRAGHHRLDITVVDELSDNQSPLLPGWIRKDAFP
jgi:hypothetical protein